MYFSNNNQPDSSKATHDKHEEHNHNYKGSAGNNYNLRFSGINLKWQNQQSSRQKKRVQYVLYAHLFVWTLVFLRLSHQIAFFFGVDLEILTGKLEAPPIKTWEVTWLVFSLPVPFLGLSSITSNRILSLRAAMIIALLGGYGPVLWGVMSQLWDLADYYQTRRSEYSIFGVPLVIIWYIQFTACIQIHGFTIFFGLNLIKIWRAFKKED